MPGAGCSPTDGVPPAAAGPRRGRRRGGDRRVARGGRPARGGGRPAGGGADRQDHRRDPVPGGRRGGRAARPGRRWGGDGGVAGVLAGAGDVVAIGTALLVIGDEETAAPAVTPAAPPGRVQAPPAVRRLAAEPGIDLAGGQGTGPGGAVR